jgi:hypothetical protein
MPRWTSFDLSSSRARAVFRDVSGSVKVFLSSSSSSVSDIVSYSSSSSIMGSGIWAFAGGVGEVTGSTRRGLFSSDVGVTGHNLFLCRFRLFRMGGASGWIWGFMIVARSDMILCITGRIDDNACVSWVTAGTRVLQQWLWGGAVGGVGKDWGLATVAAAAAYVFPVVVVVADFKTRVVFLAADMGMSSRRARDNSADSFWNLGQSLERTSWFVPQAAHFGAAVQFCSSWVPS